MRADELDVGELVLGREPNLARTVRVGRVVRLPEELVARGEVIVRWRDRVRGTLGRPIAVAAASLQPHSSSPERKIALPLEAR